jgi:DTW domain
MATTKGKALTLLDLGLELAVEPRSLPKEKVHCRKCNKRVAVLCPDCLVLSGIEDPEAARVHSKLPLKVHVWRSSQESNHGKSTSVHIVSLLQDGDAEILPLESLPSYEEDPGGVLILFPSEFSCTARELPDLNRFHTLAVIDCTWNKTGGVIQKLQKDMKEGKPAASFQHVHIGSYETLFWRYQSLGAHCLSTVESVYYFLREFLVEKARREAKVVTGTTTLEGTAKEEDTESDDKEDKGDPCDVSKRYYKGEIDNLVLLFLSQYYTIQERYVKENKEFTAKHRPGYIKKDGDGNSSNSSSSSSSAATAAVTSSLLPMKRSHAEANAHANAGAGKPVEGVEEEEEGEDGGDEGGAVGSATSAASAGAGAGAAGAPQQQNQQQQKRRPPKGASFVRADLLDPAAAATLRRKGDGASSGVPAAAEAAPSKANEHSEPTTSTSSASASSSSAVIDTAAATARTETTTAEGSGGSTI